MTTEKAIVIDYVLPDRRHSQGIQKAPLASYTLALLLAQTPSTVRGCRVVTRVHDEQAEGRYDPATAQPDILCLTYLTTGALRAYQISEEARAARNHDGDPIRIIHGGVHATSLPREALKHCHMVVRGEITQEFQRQLLEHAAKMDPSDRAVVRLPKAPDVISRPPADWSWMNRRKYLLAPVIQTSVGCPFHCDFCSVTEVFGAGMRAVSEESLRAELSRLPKKAILPIIDDNFLQGVQPRHTDHCMRVASIMHEMGFRWVTEVTARTLMDARKRLAQERPGFDLLTFFAEHGCLGFFFGIETIEEGAGLSKYRGAAEMIDLVRACHERGIGVLGAFVLGVGPDETPDYAKRVLDFAVDQARLDFAQFSINTPMPGAQNFLTGLRDGRIFNFDWELYDAEHCVMRHPKMTPEELEATHRWLNKEFYSYRSTLKRYDLLALLALNRGVWRRVAVGVPANLVLHNTARSWNNRLNHAVAREMVPQPEPEVLAHVQEALGTTPHKPGDLFNLHRQDTLSLSLVE